MRKPCTDCPYNEKSRIEPPDGGHKSVWHHCRKGLKKNEGSYLGYYEMVANCVDYVEWLAWQRANRKKRQTNESNESKDS